LHNQHKYRKLRSSSNGCLRFKANDHENKPYVGISRIRRYRMVDMCKGKRKYDYEAPMTSSLSDCTWLERVEVSSLNNVTSFLALYFFFHLIHPSHIFLATPLLSFSSIFFFSITLFHSLIHIYIFFISLLLYFSFFLFPYTYFSPYFSLS
jgi:hypothetical protein